MSTLLQLVQRACAEAELASTPTSAVAQTGQYGRIANWVIAADQEIQNSHAQWQFLRFDFSFQTGAAVQTYTPTAAGYPELATWKLDSMRRYLTATGASVELDLEYVPWEDFRDLYLRGVNRTQSGPPNYFSVKPDKTLIFWPIPDAIYTVVGEYWKRAQALALDTDVPLYPSQFHLAPVWKALMSYGLATPAPEAFSRGRAEYAKITQDLELDQLPDMVFGEPMT